MPKIENGRETYLDLLRILASIAVVTIHTIGGWCYGNFSNKLMWAVIFDSLVRWAVPLFVMISGALLLRDTEIKFMEIKRRIIRLAKLFFIWSFLLITFEIFYKNNLDTKRAVIARICNGGHLYYLYIAMGLYLVLPFLNFIYRDVRLLKYFLVLWIIFTFVIPRSQIYISHFLNEMGYSEISSAMEFAEDISSIHIPVGYSGYFLLGGYLNRKSLPLKKGVPIYLIGAIVTIAGTLGYSLTGHTLVSHPLFEYFAVNTLFMCIGVFIVGKCVGEKIESRKTRDVLSSLSADTMGIYFIHPIIINIVSSTNVSESVIFAFPLLTIPMTVLVYWGISRIIISIIKKIPVVKQAV